MTEEMRLIYAAHLTELAEQIPEIVVLEADLMSPIVGDMFSRAHPDRVYDVGVAEANMMGIAAGLSMSGKIPFVHTFASFATRRCYDQLFVSVAYTRQNVKITGFDPGICAGNNGGTHVSFEDIALTRVIPDMVVVEPADAIALKKLLPAIVAHRGCSYLRLQRIPAPVVYAKDEEFALGKGKVLRDGKDLSIVAAGSICVSESLKAADILEKKGYTVAVIDVCTIQPIDKELIIRYAKKTKAMLSCENHQIINGLGSAVAELLVEHCPIRMLRHGIRGMFGEAGSMQYLRTRFALEATHIANKALRLLKG